jgi:hypothetical protein
VVIENDVLERWHLVLLAGDIDVVGDDRLLGHGHLGDLDVRR